MIHCLFSFQIGISERITMDFNTADTFNITDIRRVLLWFGLGPVSLVNITTESTASNVRCCQLRMLFPSIVHCIWHFTTNSLQSQMFRDIFENAILHRHINCNGHICTGFHEVFTTSKYTQTQRILFITIDFW